MNPPVDKTLDTNRIQRNEANERFAHFEPLAELGLHLDDLASEQSLDLAFLQLGMGDLSDREFFFDIRLVTSKSCSACSIASAA